MKNVLFAFLRGRGGLVLGSKRIPVVVVSAVVDSPPDVRSFKTGDDEEVSFSLLCDVVMLLTEHGNDSLEEEG